MTELKHSVSVPQPNSSLTKGIPKMSKLKKFIAACGILFSLCVASPVAFAQDVLVFDAAGVFKDSKAGQDLSAKVTNIGNTMEAELTPEKNALTTEKASLDAKLNGKTPEQIRADEALVAQGRSYTRKVQTFAQKSDKRARELVATERTALGIFAQKLRAAVEAVRAKRNGKLVLDKSNAYIHDPSIDITADVIAEMDRIAPTITVQQIKLPDQPAQSGQ